MNKESDSQGQRENAEETTKAATDLFEDMSIQSEDIQIIASIHEHKGFSIEN